ncbi:hypothetical protein M5X11_10225 [Paenibacillus alginolyticus]|nr:hypothetical protein [Paenibacillus alginolyticus]MCY9665336.1 hypothetical protein [Paenibacillus alginolyticus]
MESGGGFWKNAETMWHSWMGCSGSAHLRRPDRKTITACRWHRSKAAGHPALALRLRTNI